MASLSFQVLLAQWLIQVAHRHMMHVLIEKTAKSNGLLIHWVSLRELKAHPDRQLLNPYVGRRKE